MQEAPAKKVKKSAKSKKAEKDEDKSKEGTKGEKGEQKERKTPLGTRPRYPSSHVILLPIINLLHVLLLCV